MDHVTDIFSYPGLKLHPDFDCIRIVDVHSVSGQFLYHLHCRGMVLNEKHPDAPKPYLPSGKLNGKFSIQQEFTALADMFDQGYAALFAIGQRARNNAKGLYLSGHGISGGSLLGIGNTYNGAYFVEQEFKCHRDEKWRKILRIMGRSL